MNKWRSKKIEDKLREKLDLSLRNDEELRVEVEKARNLLVNMTMSKEKLDRMINDLNVPCDKKGLGLEDDKESPTPNKTMFVKSLGNKEVSPVQTPKKKLDLG